MNKEVVVLIQFIKDEIQSKFGEKVSCAADCQILSEQIQNLTQRQISVSTIKRFFGIIESTFNPSKYTLDTLAIYLQFDNWQEFISNIEKEKLKCYREDAWDNLKIKANTITSASLKSLKNKIGARFEKFPLRSFAEKKLEDFLRSSKIATAFIAPEGYGKSTIVTQLTEKFYTGADAIYPNDIVCLVDGSILYNLLSLNPIANQLYNLIEYNPITSFAVAFRNNPDLLKGRILVIIEGVDDIYSDCEKTEHFVDNLLNIISSYENIGWYKILITCSPAKWRIFTNRMQNNQILRSLWFDVAFLDKDDAIINIPLLKRKEIVTILEKNNFPQSLDDLCFNQPDILEIINNPYMLHLFLATYIHTGTIRDIDLLNQYIIDSVFSSPHTEEKFLIVKSFFALCEDGKKGNEVRKEDLNLSSSTVTAYNELIRSGILCEYSVNDIYLSLNTFVKFSQNILFSYYLANILLKKNELNTDFLKGIIGSYSNTPNLRCNLIKYIVKILFKDEKVDLLKDIFSIIDMYNLQENVTTSNIPSCVLTNVIGLELRKNKKLREILIPWYAKSESGHKLYFEKFFDMDCLVLHSGNDLDCYLKYNQSDDAKQYVCFMKFMQHFFSENIEGCKSEYENSLKLKLPSGKSSLNSSFYYIPQIIYQSVYEKKLNKNILEEVYRISYQLLQSGIQNRTDDPHFEITIIFALNYGAMYKEIIDLAKYIFGNYDLSYLKSSCFYQLFLSVYAKALLETGETKKAVECYEQVKFNNVNIPEHMKYYVKVRLLIIKTEFLIYKGEFKKVWLILEKIKSISKMLKFSYFYNCALEIEKRILTMPDTV